MKVIKTNKEINKIIEIKNENIEVSYFYHDLLDEYYNIVDSVESTYFDKIIKLFNFNKEDISFLKSHKADKIICLDEKKYLNNDYYKNISLKNIKSKDISYYQNYYEPYEVFLYDDLDIENLKEISKVGYFKKRFNYITIMQDNKVWMSITPHEINTMEKAIDEAKGNVLVYGLGLGYYAYMVSNKDNVKSVTIVEYNNDIIDLFNKHILPQFKNKDKIKIIHEDAFKYKANGFNYHFIDLWHDEVDGLEMYIKLKRIYPNASYWIEDSIIAMVKRILISLVEESLLGFNDSNYKKSKNEIDKITNRFYELTKNININSEDDLITLLSDQSLIDLYKKY